jgi:hypothetical protein
MVRDAAVNYKPRGKLTGYFIVKCDLVPGATTVDDRFVQGNVVVVPRWLGRFVEHFFVDLDFIKADVSIEVGSVNGLEGQITGGTNGESVVRSEHVLERRRNAGRIEERAAENLYWIN